MYVYYCIMYIVQSMKNSDSTGGEVSWIYKWSKNQEGISISRQTWINHEYYIEIANSYKFLLIIYISLAPKPNMLFVITP